MKIKTGKEIIERIKEITKDIGLVCLIPKTGNSGVTCHEHTLCDHEVKELLWKIYSQAQSDLLESCSEGMIDAIEKLNNVKFGGEFERYKTYWLKEVELWEECSLLHAKIIKEKDERIKELEEKFITKNDHDIILKHALEMNFKPKYQEAVKDIDYIMTHYMDMSYSKMKEIKSKYGLDKQESKS